MALSALPNSRRHRSNAMIFIDSDRIYPSLVLNSSFKKRMRICSSAHFSKVSPNGSFSSESQRLNDRQR